MARQRFIWPTIWSDPEFGRLKDTERVFFIGLFSNADDEGRLLADPSYLRSIIWPYADNLTGRKVKAIRDSVTEKCSTVHLYEVDGIEYITLRKWSEYQHPKYPKPSAHPPPYSPNVPPTLEEDSPKASPQGWVGLDRDGLGWEGKGLLNKEPSLPSNESRTEPPEGLEGLEIGMILKEVDAA